MNQPKKPTQTFGEMSFSKAGKVTQHLYRLSDVKPVQEKEAIERFVEIFNASMPERQLSNARQLPENDHDFLLETAGSDIHIQLTELVNRSFTFAMSQEEYDSCKWTVAVQKA